MTSSDLANLRRSYSKRQLSEETVAADPFEQFSVWMQETLRSEIIDANAMILSTVSADCRPSSRVVLLKGFDKSGFVFFTNYESRKSSDLASNPNAVIHFFWAELERQINITGSVTRVSRDESEKYFRSRPLESKIGAWASRQSSIVESREALEKRYAELKAAYSDGEVPCPPFWGGFRLQPERFEFWQGRDNRLHDRICYTVKGESWQITRLSP